MPVSIFEMSEPLDAPIPVEPLRVLIVHNRYRQPGGEDVVADAQKQLLAARGHDVRIFERDNKEINSYSLLGKAALYFKTAHNRASAREIIRVVKEFRPRVAHVHNTLPLISPSIYAPLNRSGVKVIQWLHNYRLVCPAGTLYRDGAPCTLCLEGDLNHAIKYKCWTGSSFATKALVRMLRRHRRGGTWIDRVDLFVALNSFQKKVLVAQGGLPESKVVVLPNFSDTPVLEKPAPAGADGEFLFAARLTPEKGVGTLLRALESLRDVPVVIAGEGPMSDIVERACTSPVHNYLGRLDRAALRQRMESARAVLFCSEWPEGCPSVILEAMACGKPVIASSVPGATDLIEEGRTGLFFPPGNFDALADCVRQFIASPQLEQQMGVAALERFKQRHSRDAGYLNLLELYARLGVLGRE